LSEKRYFKLIHEVRVMSVINTNIAANIAANAINKNDREMATAMERLSTGSRINSAKDDAAGLAIADRMSAQISGLEQASRNANDAISMLQTAEGATKEISNMLGRMRELAVQSANGTYSDNDRASLDLEFGALMDEITRIAEYTEWNGNKILAGNVLATTDPTAEASYTKTIQLGASSGQAMSISLNSWQPKVALDTDMTAASGTGANGADPATGSVQEVTFKALANGDSYTLAGITVVATGVVTAADQETYFAALADGEVEASQVFGTNATGTGTFTGFDTATGTGGDSKVNFTNTGQTNASKTIAVTTIAGTNSPTVAAPTGGSENPGAYGSGALFFGAAGSENRINITAATNSSQAIIELDRAINGAAAERAKYGAYMSRLQHASDNLLNTAANTAASRSQIADADYASETMELARTQIISQASTAMLAQANQSKQTVLSLLQG
jgi:flagellin